MATLGDDCYFFFTSTCAKGSACPFRHVEAAKSNRIICQHWQMGGCYRPMCKFRHSSFEVVPVGKTEVACFWESQPSGCTKANCGFKHVKPRPTSDIVTSTQPATAAVTAPVAEESSSGKFSVPQVPPVIIQPAESEESNSSPIKRPPNVSSRENGQTQESKADLKDVQASLNKTEGVKEEIGGFETDKTDNLNVKSEKVNKSPAPSAEGKPKVKKVKKLSAGTVKGKKVVAKKKPGAVKKKVGTAGTAVKGKKMLKPKAGAEKKAGTKVPPRQNVKDRLGSATTKNVAKVQGNAEKDHVESSAEDSDDSIENIKVMSMEEIFRQKALESMMKKRAAAGKEPLPTEKSKVSTPKSGNVKTLTTRGLQKQGLGTKQVRPVTKTVKVVRKSVPALKRKEPEDEESEDEDESSSSSSESSDSSSSDTSEEEDSEDSNDFEPDVRRVVVDVDSEKAARRRAKASLLAKKKLQAQMAESAIHRSVTGRVGKTGKKVKSQNRLFSGALESLGKKALKESKKRVINMDYDSDGIVPGAHKRLSIRDRLGKSTADMATSGVLARASRLVEAHDAGVHSAGEGSPRKTVLKTAPEQAMESEDESDPLSDVKVKTLEEIRREKIRKMAAEEGPGSLNLSPVRKRLDMSTFDKDEEPSERGRQVMIVTEPDTKMEIETAVKSSEDQKKQKRRPWKSQKRNLVEDGGDERKTVIKGPEFSVELDSNLFGKQREVETDESPLDNLSPFAQLRRKALQKKLESRKQRLGPVVVCQESDSLAADQDVQTSQFEAGEAQDGLDDGDDEGKKSSKSRKHKHKHKHKKSKGERQIYMPPALKKSVALVKPTQALSHVTETVEVPEVEDSAAAVREGRRKRGPHPMAAAWSAGLSLSSKGGMVKRPEMAAASGAGMERKIFAEPTVSVSARSRLGNVSTEPAAPASTSESSEVSIKSFSEIMAEKRRRRLEMQAQKAASSTPGSALSSSGAPVKVQSTAGVKPFNSSPLKSRVPISPIVFEKDPVSRVKSQPMPTAVSSLKPTVPEPPHGSSAVTVKNRAASASTSVVPPTQKVLPNTGNKTLVQGGFTPKKKLFKKRVSVERPEEDAAILDLHDNSLSLSLDLSDSSSPIPFKSPKVLSVNSNPVVGSDNNRRTLASAVDAAPSFSVPAAVPQNKRPIQPAAPLPAQGDVSLTLSAATAPVVSSSSAVKHKSPAAVEPEIVKKKSRLSLDDEFALLDGGDFAQEENAAAVDEDIDDLLQDIDDLLA
ncbi:zinc finger CCCH domain-containing protein 11A [Aplysia californica]|uniref:Zinc finger CCCH domain-containing protein 11A n=1 Tax=Aplysia californica TaxID=6500 RepID=A0ABM0JLH3_APLCA|nr:zinc finger CCCH domain-containing protein 11A [Aplysia californica]